MITMNMILLNWAYVNCFINSNHRQQCEERVAGISCSHEVDLWLRFLVDPIPIDPIKMLVLVNITFNNQIIIFS